MLLPRLDRVVSGSSDQIYINPLTPGAFCEKGVSWTFWWFLGWMSAKLASI